MIKHIAKVLIQNRWRFLVGRGGVLLLLCTFCAQLTADYGGREDVEAFIEELNREDGFDPDTLRAVFDQAVYKQSIIDDVKPFRKYLFDHYAGDEGEDVIKAHAQTMSMVVLL